MSAAPHEPKLDLKNRDFGRYIAATVQNEKLTREVAALRALVEQRDAALRKVQGVIARHRRHVELSPGVGETVQRYALGVFDDIESDLRASLTTETSNGQ